MLRSLLLLLITLHFGLGADELGSVYRPQHSRSFLVREKSLALQVNQRTWYSTNTQLSTLLPYPEGQLSMQMMTDTRELLHSNDIHENNPGGYVCSLSPSDVDQYRNAVSKTWIVDEQVLDAIDRDLQSVINCTQKGDVVLFNTSSPIRPSSRITIPWTLTISAYVPDVKRIDGVFPHSEKKSIFICPRKNEGLFRVQAESVTFANAVFQECSFGMGEDRVQSIIKIEKCQNRQGSGKVQLHWVGFRDNRLIGAVGLKLPSPDCLSVKMVDVFFAKNTCSRRGCFASLPSNSRVKRCSIYKNKAAKKRNTFPSILYTPAGSKTIAEEITANRNTLVVFEAVESSVYMKESQFIRNGRKSATNESLSFSCVSFDRTAANIKDCIFKNNIGKLGAAIYTKRSNVVVTGTSFEDNRAVKGGSLLFEDDSKIVINGSRFTRNQATLLGGCMIAMDSTLVMRQVEAKANFAGKRGGCVAAKRTVMELRRVVASDNSAGGDGGCISMLNSQLDVSNSKFTNGTAVVAGGIISADKDSSLKMVRSWMIEGRAEGGGAVALNGSHLRANNITIEYCGAELDGGGVRGNAFSDFLCVYCTIRHNTAGRNGGAISFDSDGNEVLTVQLTKSRIEHNSADRGGDESFDPSEAMHNGCVVLLGGLHFVSSRQNGDCLAKDFSCPFAAIVNTIFDSNEARNAGGAMFVGYSGAIRFQCGPLEDGDDLLFYKRRQWETFYCLTKKYDMCSAWRGNKAALYGDKIGTYAATAQLIVEDRNDKKDAEWSRKQKIFKNYSNGTVLPAIRIRLLDGLGQKHATSYHDIVATMSSPDDFFADAITVTLKDGAGSFSRVAGYAPPGEHRVVIKFNDEAIESLYLKVHVRQCRINEETSEDSGCDPCNDSSFNFDPQSEKCQKCPDHGNCESNIILPEPTFWHPMPCSVHVQKCLASEACKPDGRGEHLEKVTRDVENCSFTSGQIDDYRSAQCLEGHTGPLCGSCQGTHGNSLSSTCTRCSSIYTNVCFIVFSILGLLMFTSITMRGNLNVPSELQTEQTSSCESHNSEDDFVGFPELFEIECTTTTVDHHTVQVEEPNETADTCSITEKLLAKWKAIEMLKITMTYVQVTVLITSIDAGWTFSLLLVAEYTEFLGGLASEGIRRCAVCVSTDTTSLHRMAMALIVDIFVIPVFSFFILASFWFVMTIVQKLSFRYLLKRYLLTMMVLWYVTFMPVMRLTLSLALCVDVHDTREYGEDTKTSYWAVDTSLECFDGTHSALIYFLALSFVCPVYGGSLILFITALSRQESERSKLDGWIYETMGFLYRSYKHGMRHFWEVAIVFRKAGIAFLIFCAHRYESVTFVVITGIFIAVAMGAHALVMPYRPEFRVLNKFELSSLFVSLLTTLITAMLKSEENPNDHWRDTASIGCMMLNGITLFCFGYFVARYTIRYIKLDLESDGVRICSNAGVCRILSHWICHEIELLLSNAGLRQTVCPTSVPTTTKTSSGASIISSAN